MGRVHLVGGEKGGVGKSVLARLLAQYWIDQDASWTGFDTDRTHGALLRHYGDFTRRIDVHRSDQLDRIVDALDDGTDEIVVDLAAQTITEVRRWLESGDVQGLLAELGHSLWWWNVLDDGKDSVMLLADLLDVLDPRAIVVGVLNRGRGRDFSLFEESKLRERILERGGHVMKLPKLSRDTMRKIDVHDKSFWAAIHNEDAAAGPCLARMERQRAKVFVRKAHTRIGAALLAAHPECDPIDS